MSSSKSYDIKKWDGVQNKYYNSSHINLPALYIQPTKCLMEHIRENNFEVPIKITGTNTSYDNQLSLAKVLPSQNVAGYRPNFQAKTNYIVFIPNIKWQSYPLTNGKIHALVSDVCDDSTPTPTATEDKIMEMYHSLEDEKNCMINILIIVVLVIGFVYILQKNDYIL